MELVVMVWEPGTEDASKFEALQIALETSSLSHADYIQDVSAKVISIGSEEAVHATDGTTYKRVVVELEASHEGNINVPLVLWDSYIQYAALFSKGDVLYLVRPYAKPCGGDSGDGNFCLECGPATMMYITPYVPQMEVVSQHPKTELPISVCKTEEGKLDFRTFPERLCVADVVPGMVNGVMMLRYDGLSRGEERNGRGVEESVILQCSDHSGIIDIQLAGFKRDSLAHIYPSQILLVSGLCFQCCCRKRSEERLCLLCDSFRGGFIRNVSSLKSLLSSPSLCFHLKLRELTSTDTHFTTVATLRKWVVQEGCGQKSYPDLDDGSCIVLNAVFSDDTDSIQAVLTPVVAHGLLQRDLREFKESTEQERQDVLSPFLDLEMILCISKLSDDCYQVNCLAPRD